MKTFKIFCSSFRRKKRQIIGVSTYFLLILMINGERDVITSSFTPFKTSSFEHSIINQSETYQFDDCSTDFQHSQKDNRTNHQPMEFTCTNTIEDGNICMVNKCSLNFYDGQIAHFCETSNGTEILMDFRLSIPVTSRVTNITYRNVFCAYCNDERHYIFWSVHLYCTPKYHNMTDNYNNSHKQTILSNLKVDKNRKVLTSNINDTMFKCSVHGLAPPKLKKTIRHCSMSSKYLATDQYKDNIYFPVEFHNSNLRRFIEYSITNAFIADNKVYFHFQFTPEFSTGDSKEQKQSCFPARDKTICTTEQKLIKDRHFQFINNEIIFFNETGTTFGPTKWCDTFDKDIIFLCQTVTEQVRIAAIYCWTVIEAISIIFFILLLWRIGTDKKKRRSLPNKVIFSYSLTMLVFQITLTALLWLPSCEVVAPIIHYLFISQYVWLSILAFDFSRMIYQSVRALKRIAIQPHSKRFSIYCIIGWISPLLIVSVALYIGSALTDNTSCDLRLAMKSSCFTNETEVILACEFLLSCITLGIIIISFVSSVYHIIIFGRQKYVELRKDRNNFRILMKLAWTMGLTFVVVCFSFLFHFEDYVVGLLLILDQFQGLILFLIHGGRTRSTNTDR